jgi:hypothetical protein
VNIVSTSVSRVMFFISLTLGLHAGTVFASGDTLTLRDDYITVGIEQFFGVAVSSDSLKADRQFQNLWAYAGLPGLRIASKSIFSAVEIDLLNRAVDFNGARLNSTTTLMQRYGIFAGMTIIDRPNQRGSLMAGAGVAGDFGHGDSRLGYCHLIYDHRFIVSDRLTLGLGILFQYHFDEWRSPVNFLPTVKWRISPRSQLQVAWDNLEIRRSLFARTVAVAELRYDLSFFRLRDRLSYEFETVGIGGGCDIRLGRDLFLRLRYKEIVFGREIVRRKGAISADDRIEQGRSIKIALVNAR